VNDGRGERQIVCGAQNFQAGDKVPLILPGAALPPKPGEAQPFVIKVGKIRSVESHGMMCSHEELGIDPETIGHRKEDGLLLLKADAVVGQPFAEYLGRSGADVVYDLEITPNRPDLNSVIGIAREISALTGNPLRLPEPVLPSGNGGPKVDEVVAVRMEATDVCPRYTARVLKGVRVGPSPDWLKSRLEQVGLRSINNVVDVSNYVMLELNQPNHLYDLDTLGGQPAGRARLALSSGPAAERVGERLTGAQRGRVRRQPLLEARRQWIEFKAEGEQRVPAADGQRITSVQHALAPDPRAERWRGRVRAGHVGVAVRGEKGLQLLVAQLPLMLEWVPHTGDGVELVDHVLREAALTAQRALARRPPD
jgi:tRNA-binding EMAP/Myf-like protein